jgi:hypothetical protein
MVHSIFAITDRKLKKDMMVRKHRGLFSGLAQTTRTSKREINVIETIVINHRKIFSPFQDEPRFWKNEENFSG